MKINLCPRCLRKPELDGCFKYDRHSDRLRFQGWTYGCPNCNCRTCVCKTDEKAAEKWNKMTKKKDERIKQMTNGEKFKTVEERFEEFDKFCNNHTCDNCPAGEVGCLESECVFKWLELENKEGVKHCPFCGGEAKMASAIHEGAEYRWVECTICHGRSLGVLHKESAIAAWNRRAK